MMKYPSLSRYDDSQLDSMHYAYGRMADLHGKQGHYALAKWANGMRTHVALELNRRSALNAQEMSRQSVLFEDTAERN